MILLGMSELADFGIGCVIMAAIFWVSSLK